MTTLSAPVRRTRIVARQFLHRSLVGQGLLIVLFWLAGQAIVRVAHLPVPGGVIGLFLVLALLASGKLQTGAMRRGAKWFIAELLLFFIPAVLAVMDHREFIGLVGLKIIAVILTGTVAVMVSTALAVDFGYRWLLRREEGLRHAAE